jgi:hypothetical protein
LTLSGIKLGEAGSKSSGVFMAQIFDWGLSFEYCEAATEGRVNLFKQNDVATLP